MSAIGTKRTWASAPHMSAFDPKRTYLRPNIPYGPSASLIVSQPQLASSQASPISLLGRANEVIE